MRSNPGYLLESFPTLTFFLCQYPLINYPGHEEKMISDSETTASSQDNFMPYIVNIEGNGSKFHDDLENNDENEDIEAYDTIEDPFDFYSKPETNVAIGSIFLQN